MVLGKVYGLIGNILGEDKPHLDELQDPVDFESGVFLDCAISWVYTFKRLIIPKESACKCLPPCEIRKRCGEDREYKCKRRSRYS